MKCISVSLLQSLLLFFDIRMPWWLFIWWQIYRNTTNHIALPATQNPQASRKDSTYCGRNKAKIYRSDASIIAKDLCPCTSVLKMLETRRTILLHVLKIKGGLTHSKKTTTTCIITLPRIQRIVFLFLRKLAQYLLPVKQNLCKFTVSNPFKTHLKCFFIHVPYMKALD